jgi:hypothetical protein
MPITLLRDAIDKAVTDIWSALNEIHPCDRHRVLTHLLLDPEFRLLLDRAQKSQPVK